MSRTKIGLLFNENVAVEGGTHANNTTDLIPKKKQHRALIVRRGMACLSWVMAALAEDITVAGEEPLSNPIGDTVLPTRVALDISEA